MPNAVKGGTARCGAGLAIAVAFALVGIQPVCAEIIRAADMLRGIQMTEAQCAARPQTVWVRAAEQEFCVRYYLSTAGGRGVLPLVFLRGDTFGQLEPATGAFAWTPPVGLAAGTYRVTARVRDRADPSFTDTETVTVQVARSPDAVSLPVGADAASDGTTDGATLAGT